MASAVKWSGPATSIADSLMQVMTQHCANSMLLRLLLPQDGVAQRLMGVECVVVWPINFNSNLFLRAQKSNVHREDAILSKVLHLVLDLHSCYDITDILVKH